MLWEQAVYVQYPSFPNYPGDFFFQLMFFFFIRWDYGVMETSAKYLLDAQVEHARLSMLWYLWSGKQPVSKSRVNQMEDYRMKIWKSLENLETPRVHRW